MGKRGKEEEEKRNKGKINKKKRETREKSK